MLRNTIEFSVLIVFLLIFTLFYPSVAQEGLPFCGLPSDRIRYVIVSTLDGKLTALNPDNGGTPIWSIHPGDAPMLSSSIHRLEISSYGQLIRMIPSLSGGLYRFNGQTVEAIPLTADNLLHASFRYSDNLVMSGGKESRTLGVSLSTGEILYECSLKSGCKEEGGSVPGDVLVVQRQGQVVRAVEPRSGVEKWNFSVAQHEVKLLSECHQSDSSLERLNLKVVIPEGLICAVDQKSQNQIEWKHKFESPVVNAWEVTDGQVYEIDLFKPTALIAGEGPGIYIGMHENQLYIQESLKMLKKREALLDSYRQNMLAADSPPQLPWKPISASSTATGLVNEDEEIQTDDDETALEKVPSSALSVLEAVPSLEGHGFFLYTAEALKSAEEALCNATTKDNTTDWLQVDGEAEKETLISLWYWWKEVTIISITTALLFNVMFTRGYFPFFLRVRAIPSQQSEKLSQPSDSGVHFEELSRSRGSSESEFVSRYLTDFVPERCLGRGGFGVVFKAKNKIDDCHYAIKRIVLPDAEASRERVLREVRALAKLDHQNIVRYFNSWLESPPAGWDKEQNELPCREAESALSVSLLETSTVSQPQAVPSKDCDPSDSFIVFAAASQDEHAVVVESSDTSNAVLNHSPNSVFENESGVANSTQTSICVKTRSRSGTSAAEWCKGRAKVYLYIQMQLCQQKSLRDWLRENQDRNYKEILHIFEQILMAVEYVHGRNLIHRDLKPSNIFFSYEHQIKIGDFGLVTTMEDNISRQAVKGPGSEKGHTAQVGTQLYMSPEQLAGKSYNQKVDIFSLGMILFELLVPFSTEMERIRTLQDVKKLIFPKSFMEAHKNEHALLKTMLSRDPDERPTIFSELLRPPFQVKGKSNVSDASQEYSPL